MIAVGVGRYMEFLDELREIAGDNVYTADNFDELSNLFNEILVECCSKYSLRDIERAIHLITTLKAEIRTDTFSIIITIMGDFTLALAQKSNERCGNENCKGIRKVQ